MLRCIAFALLVVPRIAHGQPARLVPSGASLTIPNALEGKRVPVWSGNALVVAEGGLTEPNAFLAYDRSGKVVFNAAFSIPGSARTSVRGYARGADGTLALCGSSLASDGRSAPFFAWIPADGGSQEVVRTEPYTPNLITVAPDGTFWTVGRELNSRLSEKDSVNLNAGVLRHFDRSGKTLGAYLPRSGFENPVELGLINGYLAASADRVGWFHYMETTGEGAYVEISRHGELTVYPIPRLPNIKNALQVDGMALTDANDVFVSMRDVGAHSGFSIFWLNRSMKKWLQVAVSPGVTGDAAMLYGASGSELVLRLPDDPPSTLHFFAPKR